jgi:hypothetical protein
MARFRKNPKNPLYYLARNVAWSSVEVNHVTDDFGNLVLAFHRPASLV